MDANTRGAYSLPRKLLVCLFPLALMSAALFGAAGRIDIAAFWVYLGIWCVMLVVGIVVTHRSDPTLFQERMKPGPGGKDPWMRRLGGPLLLAHLVVAGLDVGRYGWTGAVPLAAQVAGFVVIAAALAIALWAQTVNRFFSSEVRIQRDRGHHVITTGPYHFIRHPGYACFLVACAAAPVALGSWWSVVPLLLALGMLLRRIRIEDRLLLAELEGYAEYAQRTRFRLLPGVW